MNYVESRCTKKKGNGEREFAYNVMEGYLCVE